MTTWRRTLLKTCLCSLCGPTVEFGHILRYFINLPGVYMKQQLSTISSWGSVILFTALTHFNCLSSRLSVALGNQKTSILASCQHNFASKYNTVINHLSYPRVSRDTRQSLRNGFPPRVGVKPGKANKYGIYFLCASTMETTYSWWV